LNYAEVLAYIDVGSPRNAALVTVALTSFSVSAHHMRIQVLYGFLHVREAGSTENVLIFYVSQQEFLASNSLALPRY